MYRKFVVSALIITILMSGGCAAVREFVREPSVKFEGVSFRDMSLFEATPVFKLNITNPNPIGITVGKIAYALKINGKPFIKNTLDKGLTINAGRSAIAEVPVTFNYLDVLESLTALNRSDTIPYDLSGSVNIGILNLPYHTKGDLPVPKLPKVSLKNIGISNLSLTGASMIFSLELENRNSFTVQMNGLDYGIKLGGKEFAAGNARSVTAINKNGTSSLEIPLNVSFLSMGRSVYNVLTGTSAGYELSGNMKFNVPKVGEKSFPFQSIGQVPFKR